MSLSLKNIVISILILSSTLGVFHLINQYFNLADDNPIEQDIEQLVQAETGVKIDLTPTPEVK